MKLTLTGAMWAHLFTKSSGPPQDYIDLFLCRDVYHCTPGILDMQKMVRVFKHLKVLDVEQKVDDLRNRKPNAHL